MSYKTILIHIDPGKRSATRVEAGVRLAVQQGAHLVALCAQAPFVLPGYLVEVTPEVIEAHKKAAAEERARSEADFNRQLETLDFNHAEWRSTVNFPVDALSRQARYADLVIVGQTDPADRSVMSEDLAARMVLAVGRPVLILPYVGTFPSIGKRILVAWNASPEASRAVTAALPLLKLAGKVDIMSVHSRHGVSASDSGDDILPYLERHGVRAELMTDHVADIDVGNGLLSRAADLGSDLLVMGGYGHSRLREWVLGGATRTILESMTLPVLMYH